jgi:(S)-2-hydroxyglutarate dehydrogenase
VPGKLIVATTDAELARLRDLQERALTNALAVEALDAAALREREPNVTGLAAMLVPSTGIVDYTAVARQMAREIEARGGVLELGVAVTGIRESAGSVVLEAGERHWEAARVVVCGGLQADRLARLSGLGDDFQIVPFRGEYYRFPASRNDVVRHLIYPVPDPSLPFLGVHLTRMIDGGVTVGPNAVLGFAREGYPRLSFERADVAECARFPGLWRVARDHARTGVREMRNSLWKKGYLQECRRYCPDLTLADLLPEEAGIRAQAVLRDGTLVHDFLLRQTARTLHVCNAPSPAATSAIPIASLVVDRLLGVAAPS